MAERVPGLKMKEERDRISFRLLEHSGIKPLLKDAVSRLLRDGAARGDKIAMKGGEETDK
ncbi:unnamed protein product, partial [Symbiodinium sp. KB8]